MSDEQDDLLKDLLFNTNLPLTKIAEELGWTKYQLNKRMNYLGLNWVKRYYKKLSRGHAALLKIMQNLLPGEEVVTEHHIGERLMLDVYCPKYKIAAEYHGRQHFEYVEHFHNTKQDFIDGQARDERKAELCKEQGIALIVFRYNDTLTEEVVFDRMLTALRSRPEPKKEDTPEPPRFKGNAYYEKMKRKNREYQKAQYQKLKKQQKRKQKHKRWKK